MLSLEQGELSGFMLQLSIYTMKQFPFERKFRVEKTHSYWRVKTLVREPAIWHVVSNID